MAAECIGAPFFRYRFPDVVSIQPEKSDVVWVNRRYTPTDLRVTTPVQRWKFLVQPIPENLSSIPKAWRYQVDAPSEYHARDKEESRLLPYSHATRCEEWSTLRQILPSRGYINKVASPRWGTGPPNRNFNYMKEAPSRFPHINSPMTRYVDDMHVNHRKFKLH
ncbi:uncharacterized protein LOC114532526 [Dendronephthya gigantea]|uniref:uncharacterized protein LOC114532526 n=1 Tax=Dendronephthya gigantea TaxID=151771 RepID=UPI00106902AB|nr:uncharacterized protein LOC114532526 [Dendronephthya gigantea]